MVGEALVLFNQQETYDNMAHLQKKHFRRI